MTTDLTPKKTVVEVTLPKKFAAKHPLEGDMFSIVSFFWVVKTFFFVQSLLLWVSVVSVVCLKKTGAKNTGQRTRVVTP